MTDPLTWSPISLGKWGSTSVRLHIFMVLFVVSRLLVAALAPGWPVGRTAAWLLVLLVALLWHELGHVCAALWLGCEPDDIRLWPLGNMVGPSPQARSGDQILVALGGPLASFTGLAASVILLNFFGARFVWNPFGGAVDSGAPLLFDGTTATPATPLWWLGWFGYLCEIILLANLIPALPFDGGRFLRGVVATSGYGSSRDGVFPLWTAHSCAFLLFLVGLARLLISGFGDGVTLLGLAVLIELIVRTEARGLDDGALFDDGVFGYDFSEGYTSFESSAAKVQPYRESALNRWRRRRTERRRRHRAAREAADERRMDQILEKLHRDGKSALSREEHRFLVRVSTKIRNRPKP